MTWDIFNDSFLLLRAFGNSIELTFSEGEEREEPYDLGAVPGLKKMSEGIRTRHPNYHLQSGSLHSAITIRRAQGTTSVQEAPSKAVEKGLDALEQASEETDTLVVDALLSGHSSAVGVRYAESGKGDVFRTQFFHSRPFADVEADFLNWIQSSLENEVFERRRQGEDFSSLQKPIASFGKALEQSDLEVSVTGGEEELSYRIRAFASCL